jgi:hypothetical protein
MWRRALLAFSLAALPVRRWPSTIVRSMCRLPFFTTRRRRSRQEALPDQGADAGRGHGQARRLGKVRDAEGTLAWIEARNLGERRTLVVTAPRAEIRQADKPDAPVLAELDKWVALNSSSRLRPAGPRSAS